MYNAQIVKDRINARAAALGVSVRSVLADCGLHPNTVNQMKDAKGLSCFSLATLADRLDCSVDYLLGREELLTTKDCIAIVDAINNGADKAELIATYGGDLARHWSEFESFAAIVKREEAET